MEDESPARRFIRADAVALGLRFLSDLATAVDENLTRLSNAAAMHANYRIQQREFREQAAIEIETLVSGDE